MMPRKKPERFTDANVLILLDEIAKRLADQTAEGVMRSHSITVGTVWKTLEVAWVTATIYNDGDADVYIHLDDMSTLPWTEGEAPLKKGENITLAMGGRQHVGRLDEEAIVKPLRHGSPLLCFICQAGTAAIRVFKLV